MKIKTNTRAGKMFEKLFSNFSYNNNDNLQEINSTVHFGVRG